MLQDSLEIQLKIHPHLQVVAGFLIESMDAMAIHSQGKDADHLKLLLNESTLSEIKCFAQAWDHYYIKCRDSLLDTY